VSKSNVIIAILISLLSCNSAEEQTTRTDDKYGGILHLNVSDNIYSLVPDKISNESEWFIASQVYETVTNGSAINSGLIKSIREVHPDTIYFDFRPEIKLSNGIALDSLSILPWVKQLNNNGLNCIYDTQSNALIVINAGTKVANSYLSRRDSYLFSVDNGIPIGTGPFRLISINEDISIDLVRNTFYHNDELPYVDAIELRMIKTKDTEVQEFINGSLDLITLNPLQRLQFKNVLSLEDHPNYMLTEYKELTYCFGLTYNMDSVDAYQIGKVLNDQPIIYQLSSDPRLLQFPNLSRSKIKSALMIDSDNSTFSQLTLERFVENEVVLNAGDNIIGKKKSIYLTKGKLTDNGIPEFHSAKVKTSAADYLIILNSWSGLTVNQYYLKMEDQTNRGMIDLKSVYFKEPIKLE
jgi:hypothetical protein